MRCISASSASILALLLVAACADRVPDPVAVAAAPEAVNAGSYVKLDGSASKVLLRDVQKRLGEEELTLRLTPAASSFLVDRGYDEHYGARPLKRAIQKYVEDPLSEKILVGEFAKGDEIEVDVAPDKERLAFRALTGTKA